MYNKRRKQQTMYIHPRVKKQKKKKNATHKHRLPHTVTL